MEFFKVEIDTEGTASIGISWYLMEIQAVELLWNSFKVNKIEAARLISYALYMSDISAYNPYRGISADERSPKIREDLWGNSRYKRVESNDVNDIILALYSKFSSMPEYNRVESIRVSVGKIREYLQMYKISINGQSDLVNPDEVKEFQAIAINSEKQEEVLARAEKLLTNKIKNNLSLDDDDTREEFDFG